MKRKVVLIVASCFATLADNSLEAMWRRTSSVMYKLAPHNVHKNLLTCPNYHPTYNFISFLSGRYFSTNSSFDNEELSGSIFYEQRCRFEEGECAPSAPSNTSKPSDLQEILSEHDSIYFEKYRQTKKGVKKIQDILNQKSTLHEKAFVLFLAKWWGEEVEDPVDPQAIALLKNHGLINEDGTGLSGFERKVFLNEVEDL